MKIQMNFDNKEAELEDVEVKTINMVRGEINIPFLVKVINIINGEYGKQKVVRVNGRNEPMALPIIKDLKPLEIGKYYLLKRGNKIPMSNGYSRVPYTVKKCDETYYNRYAKDYKALEVNLEMEEIPLLEDIE